MKKIKRILINIFAIIVIINMVNIVNIAADEIESVVKEDNLETTDMQEMDMPYLQDTMIEPAFIKTSNQAVKYSQTEINISEEDKETTLIYPVIIPEKGAVDFSIVQSNETGFFNLTMELYSDVVCTKQCGNSIYYLENDIYGQGKCFCPYAGTYYLKVMFSRQAEIYDTKTFTLYSSFISNADRSMKENVLIYSYADNSHSDITYKIKVKRTGILIFAASPIDTDNFTGIIRLYNAKKKAISAKNQLSGTQGSDSGYARIYYTVKKGTYYLKVSAFQNYFAGYVLEKVKDRSGKSKAKATNLKIKGKAKEGVVLVSDSAKKTDWYKIKLKKRTRFTIIVESYVNGRLKMEVCNSKGKTVSFGENYLYTAKNKFRTSGKWTKGTYYIKIKKDNKKSSGYYRLKVKK